MTTPHLTQRTNRRKRRKEARQRVLDAIAAGQAANAQDVAASRGAVVTEQENSIFSEAWLPLALIFLITGFLLDRHPALIVLGVVMLLIVGISTIWKDLSLLGVSYQRTFDRTRVFPGEPVSVTATTQNRKLLPLTWLRFKDLLPIAPDAVGEFSRAASEINEQYLWQNTFTLSGFEQAQRTAVLRFPTRGYYQLGPVSYESSDIFTLFTIEKTFRMMDQIVVFPQIWPLEELGLPAKEPFGDIKVRRSLFTDPIKTQGIRDYQPQDRFRDVHWKATARRGHLQTKVYDPSTGMTMAVFLNVATLAKHWMGFVPELLERAVSVSGSVANYGMQQKWAVGMYANGSVPGSDQPIRVPPSRSPEQLGQVLEALAAVTEFATGAVENMMVRESPALPWAATIVLVTAVVTDEIAITLIRLKEAGRRVALISLADEPPPQDLGDVLTYHIPANVPAFQAGHQSQTATEAALNSIPTPKPVGLEMEKQPMSGS
ncbi:MAG: DUF58 domain-containing protein [Anaerolineae bacterium]